MAKLLSGTQVFGNLIVNSNVTSTGGGIYTTTGLFWAGNNNVISTGGGGSSPVGLTGQVQYNNGGTLGAVQLFYYTGNSSIVANAGVASTTTTSGTFQVVGGLGVTGQVTANTTVLNAGTANAAVITGNVYHAGWILPFTSNASYNIGSTSAWWGTFYGVSTQAKYADLAENYIADKKYEPGTVVVFGGDEEITTTSLSHDPSVAGVISTNPAYLMNGELENGLPVAFTGRVPCLVQGPVVKGDVLVTSQTPGVAEKIDNSKFTPGCVLGKSLGAIDTTDIRLIEVVVGRF